MVSDEIGVTHPTAIVLIPRIGGVMIITQIIENITTTEKKTREITDTEVMLTMANTEITKAIGTSILTGIAEGIENVVDTESTENIDIREGRTYTSQAECPLEHHIGHTTTLVKCL